MRELQRNRTPKPHNKIVGMSDQEENQTRDNDQREPIWFHARMVNHSGYSGFEETDRKI